jgi:YggT family protein
MRWIATLIDIYSLIVLAAVVVSWLQLAPTHPLRSTLDRFTEPVLRPIRRVLPPVSGMDLSPLVLLLALWLLGRLLF